SAIQAALGHSADLYVHRFQAFTGDTNCAFIYLRSFVDLELLNLFALSPLQQLSDPPADMEQLMKVLPYAGTKVSTSRAECAQAVSRGDVVLLISGLQCALSFPLKKYEQRSLTEPQNEKVVQGPRDGFVESIWSNIGILRQRIKNPDFRFELITLDTRTSVELGIVYIQGIANRKIVAEVRSRLARINVDRLLATGSVSEMITDSPLSPFPTHQVTERPDRLTSALLDGRIGIFLDGTPIVMMAPAVFWDFLKSPDDYTENPYFVSIVRLIRLSSHLVALLLPGAYLAVTTFHLEMLPQSLAVIIAGARTRTPFPTVVELLAMELMIEVLREAGLRMPGAFGQTLSIVGALVIGESAVTAGLIEPIIVVIVAFSTLASFVVPGYNAAISLRVLRFPLILLSAVLGFFGLLLGAMFYLMHLVSLRSFGVPYFAPVAPLFLKDMRDMYVRLPWWKQSERPTYYRPEDQIMAGPQQKPGPEKEP
ncbi:MAG: spore germination protein, partial [Desulfitobacteriaceae bacterium]